MSAPLLTPEQAHAMSGDLANTVAIEVAHEADRHLSEAECRRVRHLASLELRRFLTSLCLPEEGES